MTNIIRIPGNTQVELELVHDSINDKHDVVDMTYNYINGEIWGPTFQYSGSATTSLSVGTGGFWRRYTYKVAGSEDYNVLSFTPIHWDDECPDGPYNDILSASDLAIINALPEGSAVVIAIIAWPDTEYVNSGEFYMYDTGYITQIKHIITFDETETARRMNFECYARGITV